MVLEGDYLYKSQKGFTLLETIISIFILITIFTTATSIGIMKKNIESDINKDSDIYEIQNLMTLSKLQCARDKAGGKILIDKKNNQMFFYCGTSKKSPMKKITLSSESEYLGNNSNILLDNKGKFLNGATIYVKNDNNQVDSITIGVGVDTIKIKDE